MGDRNKPQQPSSILQIVPAVQKSLLCGLMLTATSVSAQTEINPDILSVNPSYDITRALQDRVAGVEVQTIGNKPGDEWNIIIRGLKSVEMSNQPMLVVNGLPTLLKFSDLALEEIESIQILKDASTSAIYGNRANNGVIIITTKGVTGPVKSHISYEGYVGSRQGIGRYPLMNAQELQKLRTDFGYSPVIAENGNKENANADIDWQDRLFESGFVHNHNFNLSHGWNGGGVRAALSLVNDRGIVPLEEYSRTNYMFDIRHSVGNYIHLGAMAQWVVSKKMENDTDVESYISRSPMDLHYDAEGIDDLAYYNTTKDDKSFYSNIFAELDCPWVLGLKYRFDGSMQRHKSAWPQGGKMILYRGDATTRNTFNAMKHQFTYYKIWNDKHYLSVLGQYSSDKYTQKRDECTFVSDFDGEQYRNKEVTPKEDWDFTTRSMVYRVKYDFDHRYVVSGTWNTEWCPYQLPKDALAYEGKNKKAYSLHLQWSLHNEAFLSQMEWLDAFVLRHDRGKMVGPSYLFSEGSALVLNGQTSKTSDMGVSNEEKARCYNWGLDFSFLNGRISGSVDYYKQKNSHLTLVSDLGRPVITYGKLVNVDGKTQNKGWEFALQGTIIDHLNGWTWSVGGNLYANRNKFFSSSPKYATKGTVLCSNYPLYTPCRYVYDGLWSEDDDYRDAERLGTIKVETGDIDYGDGRVEHGPVPRYVSMEPKMKGGFNTHLAWRNVDLEVVGAFQVGGYVYCNWYAPKLNYTFSLSRMRNGLKVDYWTPTNTGAHYPKPHSGYAETLGWYDASMCKIRSISLEFNVSEQWLKNVKLSSARIYATVQNPFIFGSDFYKEFKMDPETNQFGDSGLGYNFPIIGVQAPSTRNYIVGVKVEF